MRTDFSVLENQHGIKVGKLHFFQPFSAQQMSVATTAPVSSKAITHEVTVLNRQGIHARPSATFVKLASTFTCEVFVEKDGETINGKSIMGLLMLAAGPGSKLRIICDGPGAVEAAAKLVALVESKFGEP